MYFGYISISRVANTTFSNNSASITAGGIWFGGTSTIIINSINLFIIHLIVFDYLCTITSNTALNHSGIFHVSTSSVPIIRNTKLQTNSTGLSFCCQGQVLNSVTEGQLCSTFFFFFFPFIFLVFNITNNSFSLKTIQCARQSVLKEVEGVIARFPLILIQP